jgi:hypothetical protein
VKGAGFRSKEIFYIEGGQRRSIPDWDYFVCMKFEISKVLALSEEILNNIPLGIPLQI